ncbi:flocculation protein FLO11-like [Amphibalanus amphitrite]|uniref:flocculation protein FLO11-like n=1 Tax=Amphibalanus amphitrite TaxID=1232801 RepID=UPI001C91451C|nr:flocculation protein FLO11-like [Amphibalanus amphitrite]XP_043197649.1 flocculation protein FLO11-like [Amphibalanus amphitrite]XP_043197650.1 flocculation protein FLO11-like [Amphibalanus amphitrite]
MGRWHSEYQRTHRGIASNELLTTWRDNFTERQHLRETMMSSHFQLGVSGGSSSSSSTESLSGELQLSPTRLRMRHLALTSPERVPPPAPPAPPAANGGRSVRFEVPPVTDRLDGAPPAEEPAIQSRSAPPPAETEPVRLPEPPAPTSTTADRSRPLTAPAPRVPSSAPAPAPRAPSSAPASAPRAPSSALASAPSSAPASAPRVPSSAPASAPRVPSSATTTGPRRQRARSCSPASPLLGYGHGERGCNLGEQRTYNVTAPPTQVHDTARSAAERRRTAQRQRDAVRDAVLDHGRPPPRPASLWTTEYQRCYCQPVWAAERARAHRASSSHAR